MMKKSGEFRDIGRYKCWCGLYDGVMVCWVSEERQVVEEGKQIFSSYVVAGTKAVVLEIGSEPKPDEVYVLGVGYKGGDMQVAVTGSRKRSGQMVEDPRDSAVREVMEEVGVRVERESLVERKWTDTVCQFSLFLEECPAPCKRPITSAKWKDDRKRKVSVVIYGSREVLERVARIARPTDPTESIGYYAVVPVSVVVRVLGRIEVSDDERG